MPQDLKLHNAKYDVVAYDPAAKIVRVSIDLHQAALDQGRPPAAILSACKVINLTKHKEVPHRVYYTNDLQYETEQVSWRVEEGDEYRIEISSGEDTAPTMFPAVGMGEPLMLDEGPLDLGACHLVGRIGYLGIGQKIVEIVPGQCIFDAALKTLVDSVFF